MAAAALVVLEGTSLLGQQTFQFTGVHERYIAVIIGDRNKNVVCRLSKPKTAAILCGLGLILSYGLAPRN
jgi:hypothetical protein